jgi:TRAP-type C4-dicarboxylate transport system substrate-binding protein
MKIKRIIFCGISLFVALLVTPQTSFAGKRTRKKIATLAPEVSTWMNTIRDLDKEFKKESKGKLSFKIYLGGVSGDEKDVLREMRIGQIYVAGFKGVGLGEILSVSRVLDLPFLFETDSKVEFVYKKVESYFAD